MASKGGMGLLAGALAVGAGLYFLSSKSSAATAAPPPVSPVDYDLANLVKQNPSLAAAVKQALTAPTPPDDLQRLQQAVQFAYPNLGLALGQKLKATTIVTTIGTSVPTGSGGMQASTAPITISLDPLDNLHFYDKDLTPIIVVKAGPSPSSNLMLTRNPSNAFDDFVSRVMRHDLNPHYRVLKGLSQPAFDSSIP